MSHNAGMHAICRHRKTTDENLGEAIKTSAWLNQGDDFDDFDDCT